MKCPRPKCKYEWMPKIKSPRLPKKCPKCNQWIKLAVLFIGLGLAGIVRADDDHFDEQGAADYYHMKYEEQRQADQEQANDKIWREAQEEKDKESQSEKIEELQKELEDAKNKN